MKFKRTILFVIVMVLFNACGEDSTESSGNSVSLSKGLVAHYKFDGDALDSSGNENHGVEYGGVSYVDGVINQAGYFDNGYITVSNSDDLTFNDEFSISAFIKPIATHDNIYGKWVTLLTKGNDSSLDTAYEIGYECSNKCVPHIRFTDQNNKRVLFNVDGINALELNRYNFITWTFKKGQLKIYLDGALLYDNYIGISNLKQEITEALDIGKDAPGETEYFKGEIDDLRFYNRVLTPSEITELYKLKNSYSSPEISTINDVNKNLMIYYKFDGNTKDSSGNDNDGEEHGDITYVDGVIGQSANFDGIDNYIKIANKNPDSLKEFTISLYLLPKGNGGAIFNSYSWNEPIGRGFTLTLNDEVGSGVPEGTDRDFLWFGSLFDEGWFENRSKFIKTKLDRDNFLHICAVYKNGEEKLYIDGKLKASHTVEHKFDLGNYDFMIGTYAFNNATNNVVDAYGRAFKGQMDEFRFYNRALNESEIKELYQMGL